jgi:hypothetical protein
VISPARGGTGMAAAAPDASIVTVINPEVGDRTPGDAYR